MPRPRRLPGAWLACFLGAPLLAGCARPVPSPRPTPAPPHPPVIVFTGDILLAGRAERLIKQKGSAVPFAEVQPALQGADLAVGNLECSISTRGEAADKRFTFRAGPNTVAALSEAGFDVMTMANNHSVDYGRTALVDTLWALRDAGIATVGAGENAERARAPIFVETGNPPLTIALLGFSNMKPTDFYSARDRAGTNPAAPDAIRESISAARRRADVVVALFHWGDEQSGSPSQSQRQLAFAAADAGADLVVGHHPHVLQGLARRGHAIIAYSLGNFLFPSRGASKSTMILRYEPQQDGRARVEVIPCVIDDFQPRLANQKERAACLRQLRRLSGRLGATLPGPEGVIAVPPRGASVDKARTPP